MDAKTDERTVYSPSKDIAGDWGRLPPRLRALLSPWRSDDHGYPAIQFRVGEGTVVIDVKLIEMAANDDPERAIYFILAEVRTHAEGQLFARLALIA